MLDETMIKEQGKRINWNTTVFMVLFHVGAVAALFMFNWRALVVAILLWWLAGSLGIGIGFHRILTHRAVMQFLRLAKVIKLVSVAQRAGA